MKTDFALCAPMFSETGYGNHSREIYRALKRAGWRVNLFSMEDPRKYDNSNKHEIYPELVADIAELKRQPCIHIQPPPNTVIGSAYDILYTTFESATLHPGAVNRLRLFKEVWVPCKYNLKAIKKAKVMRMPAYVMPEGVDTNIYKPGYPGTEKYKYHNYFKVLYIGDWSQRKGVEKLIKAFQTADLGRPGMLTMKVNYQGDNDIHSRAVMNCDCIKWKNEVEQVGVKNIKLVKDFVSNEELVKMYNTADVYAILTMGEGWSLTVSQAMACGVPVITTNASGHLDFCSKSTTGLVKVEKWGPMDHQETVEVDFYKNQLFAHPDQKNAKHWLEHLCRNPQKARRMGERGMQRIREKYTWDKSAETIGKRMKKILGKMGKF